jgi:threonine synthase
MNPYRLEGQKTIGFEVLDQLGSVPDRIVLPVGNAGNISHRLGLYSALLDTGASVFAFDYRATAGARADPARQALTLTRRRLTVGYDGEVSLPQTSSPRRSQLWW